MSSPHQLPSKKWRVQFFDAYGKRRSATFATEAAARAGLRRRQVETDDVRSGKVRPRSEKRLAEVVPEWLATRPDNRRKDDDGRLRMHVLPALGDLKLGDINPSILERFKRDLEKKTAARPGQKNGAKLRPMTIKNILILVCKLLGDMGFPTRVKYRVPTQGYAWIQNAGDVGRFLDNCQPDWFRVAAALAVYGGLRAGEAGGLRRDAVDFERGLLRVDKSYDGPTKSGHIRWVPLSPELASILRPWLLAHPGKYVITKDGQPIAPNSPLSRYARRACKRASIEPVTYHQLRHTAASHLAQVVPLPLVGMVLGHISPTTTARYSHLDSESISRDPRLHLTFTAPSGTVLPLPSGTAHTVHTDPKAKQRR